MSQHAVRSWPAQAPWEPASPSPGRCPSSSRAPPQRSPLGHTGYGPLVPDPHGLLDLPKGFRYTVLSREGDRLRSGEGPVPSNHDGMAAFAGRAAVRTSSATTRTASPRSSQYRPSAA